MFPCVNNLGILLYTRNHWTICAYWTRKMVSAFKRLGINETASRQKFGWMLTTFVIGIVFLLIFGVNITTIDLEGKKAPKFNKEQKEQKMQTPKSNDKTFNSLSH